MKLAQIILPEWTNEKRPLFLEHALLRSLLLDAFSGYTEVHGMGCWRNGETDQREPVVVYSIAMERAAVIQLRGIAQRMCREAKQECVMIVTPCGDVEFVKGA